MPVFTLEADTYRTFGFTVRRPRIRVHYVVEAEAPVTVMILDAANLRAWQEGRRAAYYVGAARLMYHEDERVLPRGIYYLLISNPNDRPVAIFYSLE